MNKINRKVEYALMALKYMFEKHQGDLTSAKEVSDLFNCPFDVMSRVMQVMAQHGILKSVQGAHGGYQIVSDLERISFFELTEMLLGKVGIAKCLHQEDAECDLSATCNIVSPLTTLNDRVLDFYKSVSVRELVAQNARARTSQART